MVAVVVVVVVVGLEDGVSQNSVNYSKSKIEISNRNSWDYTLFDYMIWFLTRAYLNVSQLNSTSSKSIVSG